jgi:hypothetical protein
MTADPNIEVLGQKLVLPAHVAGIVGLLGIVAGFVVSVFFIMNGIVEISKHGNPEITRQLGSFFTYTEMRNNNGKAESFPQEDHKLVQFWTPSGDTQIDLVQSSSHSQIADENRWEVVTEADILKFESQLWNHYHSDATDGPVHGLRRYQEVGRGLTEHKRGWWWILNVDRSFDSKEFARFYFAEFPGSKHLYIEELNSKTEYEQ